MDWKDKTVSMGLVEKETFDLQLARVTVSENQILVELKDVEDWERIITELGEDTVLREVHWGEVEDVSTTVQDLYYPHIDIQLRRQPDRPRDIRLRKERRIYFMEEESDELQNCLDAIKRFWNQWKQRQVVPRQDRRDPDDEELDEVVELEEALDEGATPDTGEQIQAEETEPPAPENVQDADMHEEGSGAVTAADMDTALPDDTTEQATDEEEQETGNVSARKKLQNAGISGEDRPRTEQETSDSEDGDDGDSERGEDSEEDSEEDEIDDVVDQFMNE